MVALGGTVTVLPGTYAESLKITKGIRGLTIHVTGQHGIRARGDVNLTVERSTLLAVHPTQGSSGLIAVGNDGTPAGTRARAVIRLSVLDGAITKLPPAVVRPMNHAVTLQGNVDALLERNTVRRFGGFCISAATGPAFAGHMKADIIDNDIDECHPVARVGAIKVGIPSILGISQDQEIAATGTVNIIGNTFRNSSEDCIAGAIVFDTYGGRIERNRIINFLQPCATPTTRSMPAAIWIGLRGDVRLPAVAPTVRFNDIVGNAHAGLRIASNVRVKVDASCNFWGSETGPSGAGPGQGDILLVGDGAPVPLFLPFATAPVARSKLDGC